jgi:antitoxin (DNA-binding transcriptional repressor) of toxin-antitoxin stability system
MKTLSDQELQLSPTLVQALGEGETIALTHGEDVFAYVVPAGPSSSKRPFGLAKGEFTVPDDFNDPLPEVESAIYEEA